MFNGNDDQGSMESMKVGMPGKKNVVEAGSATISFSHEVWSLKEVFLHSVEFALYHFVICGGPISWIIEVLSGDLRW